MKPLSVVTAVVSSLCLVLLGWLVANELRKTPVSPAHHSGSPLEPDYGSLIIEELAMRFRHPEHYYMTMDDALTPKGRAFWEMLHRKALHKGMPKEDVEFLLGVSENRDPETGEPRDGVWRYGLSTGGVQIEFGAHGLERMTRSHDGPPDVARSEDLIK